MGVPEFSNPQLAVIQAATASIQAATNAIQSKVNADMVPITKELSQAITSGTFVTVLNITGGGDLSRAVISAPSGLPSIKVTVDGMLVHYTQCGASLMTGVLLEKDASLVRKPGVLSTGLLASPVMSYPVTNGATGSVFISEGIPFKVSLKVEVTSSVTETVTVTIEGGVYP